MKDFLLVLLISPSGGGKTYYASRLINDPVIGNFKRIITFTTRKPRLGEKNSKDYNFVTPEEFAQKEKMMIAKENIFGNMYGIHKDSILEAAEAGLDGAVLIIDYKGAREVKRLFPMLNVISIFLVPPSLEVLKTRLRSRGTETPNEIEQRLKRARQELSKYEEFDYVVLNDNQDQAYQDIKSIVLSNR